MIVWKEGTKKGADPVKPVQIVDSLNKLRKRRLNLINPPPPSTHRPNQPLIFDEIGVCLDGLVRSSKRAGIGTVGIIEC